jgi:hypothetical protein
MANYPTTYQITPLPSHYFPNNYQGFFQITDGYSHISNIPIPNQFIPRPTPPELWLIPNNCSNPTKQHQLKPNIPFNPYNKTPT